MITSAVSASTNKKTVTVLVNGKQIKFTTCKGTVREALAEKKFTIGTKDKIKPSLNSKLVQNNTVIIKRAVDVKITLNGKTINVKSAEENVGSMLKKEGVILKSEDIVKPNINTKLSQNMRVYITKVVTKTITNNVPINFKEIVKIDKTLANTKRKIVQEGKSGIKKITSHVTFVNGKEVSRKVVSETVIKKPVDKLIVQGSYPLMPVSRGGKIMPYGKVFKAKATAYWAVKGVGKTYTASGKLAVRNPEGYSTIAVDPEIIPFGTKLFVEGYGFAIAAESGTGIKGNTIDVFFDTYKEACNWAVKYVNVYILK